MKKMPKTLLFASLVIAASFSLAGIDSKHPTDKDLGIGVYNETAMNAARPNAEVPAIGEFNEVALNTERPAGQELGIGKYNESV